MTTAPTAAYLIVGEDSYLAEEAVARVLSELEGTDVEEFRPQDSTADVAGALETPSLLGDRRVVILREFDQFPGEVQRLILGYLDDPNPSVVLVLLAAKAPASLAAAVRKVGRRIEAGRPKRSEMFNWLREMAGQKGLRLSGETMTALVEAVGEDRMALAHGVEELALAYSGSPRIGPDEVRRQFHERTDTRVFGFVDAVATRQRGAALAALNRLLKRGEAPQALYWTLTRHFRMLLLAAGSTPAEVARALGLPEWRAEKLARQTRNFSEAELVAAYAVLAQADRKIKRSEEPEALTIERAVVAITG